MALTRQMLSNLKIDSDAIEEIIRGHSETVSGLKDQIDQLKEQAAKAKAAKEEADAALEKANGELDAIKKKVADDEKKNKGKDYDALKAEYDKYKADVQAKEDKAKREKAYTEILKDVGIPEKHYAKICKYSDLGAIEFDEDGKVKNAKDLMKSIKEEWSDHITVGEKKGAETPTPPTSGGGAKMTREQIMAIKDRSERQRAIAENHEVFGF